MEHCDAAGYEDPCIQQGQQRWSESMKGLTELNILDENQVAGNQSFGIKKVYLQHDNDSNDSFS